MALSIPLGSFHKGALSGFHCLMAGLLLNAVKLRLDFCIGGLLIVSLGLHEKYNDKSGSRGDIDCDCRFGI